MEHRAKKPPTAHSNQPHAVKGKCAVKNHWSYLLGSSSSSRKFSGRSVPCNIFSLCSLPPSSSGQEGDACLRSADCSEGLCCARHFWSRICKPVLTEGQVCTRHRRKGNHGLELFQRCDCGEGLACRPEKGERDHTVSRTAARNLHTCQRRWHERVDAHRKRNLHIHTPSKTHNSVTDTDKHLHTQEMLTHTHTHMHTDT